MTASTRRAAVLATLGLLGLASLSALPTLAQAQSFPNRPVRMIVPFPAGGPVDAVGRAVAQKLSEKWGQPVVVDNRPGAGGIVGAEIAAKSPGDGYTIFVCSIHHSVIPSLQKKLTYDIEKDFTPLSFGARFPIILIVNPNVKANTVSELIALDKANPGQMAFSSAGNGGGTHLAGELFNMQAGTKFLHVPYKGSAPAVTDLLGGQVQMMFADGPTAVAHIKTGRVRALAVGDPQRSALAPTVPTMKEAGLPNYDAYSWAAFVTPSSTPKDISNKMSADIAAILAQADVKKRLLDAGAEANPTTGEQFGKFLHGEIVKWTKVVKEANIQAD